MIANSTIQSIDMIGHGIVLLEKIDWTHQDSFFFHSGSAPSDEVLQAAGIGKDVLILVDPCLPHSHGKLSLYERQKHDTSEDRYFMSLDEFPEFIHCGRVIVVMNDSE